MPVISYDRLMNTGPGLCTICHSWQHTGVVHLSLQADGKVAFEDIPVFGVCETEATTVKGAYVGSTRGLELLPQASDRICDRRAHSFG